MIERRPPSAYAQSTAAEPHQFALQPPYFTMQRVLAALDAERVEHQAPRYRVIERDGIIAASSARCSEATRNRFGIHRVRATA